jgi:hypothetical protein
MEGIARLGLKDNTKQIMLPESSNVYGIIYSTYSKEEIVNRISKAGWNVNKASWFDWELTNDFSELIIDGDEEILIHGCVSTDYFNTLANILKEIELQFSLELYDEKGNLISEVKN